MKNILPKIAANIETVAVLVAIACCVACSSPKPDYGILIDEPFPGTKLSGPLAINGKYANKDSTLTEVRVELVRSSDNLFWNGVGWGSSIALPMSLNTTFETWQWSSPLPSGANLEDGWYHVTAYAHYSNHATVSVDTVFSVGITAPPIAPALYGWGMNLSGQLGAGVFNSAVDPIPVYMRGALDGKIVVAVAAGGSHTLALTAEKKIYSWGSLALGAGPLVNQSSFPVAVDISGVLATKEIVSIAAGDQHSLAADKDGAVYSWGRNTSGELGNNATGGESSVPLQVGGLLANKKVVQVVAGLSVSLALTSEGEVFSWGRNSSGQLGDGSTIDAFAHSPLPVAVTGLANKIITAISISSEHVLALTSQGEVYAWGDNFGHQLGNHSGIDSNVPVLIGDILTGKTVTAISAGRFHSMALADGKVYAWGSNDQSQLGTTTQIEHHGVSGDPGDWTSYPIELADALTGKTIVRISAATDSSFAITRENGIFGWGANLNAQLPGGPATAASVPALLDFSDALNGGRVVLDFDMRHSHGMALTGFPVELAPEIEVEAQGVELADGGSLNFGAVGQGSNNLIFIKVLNGGATGSYLKDLSASISGAGFSGVFTAPPLATGADTGFYVTFNPNTVGAASGTVQIFSNDADENPFDITLTGSAYPLGQVDLAFDPGVSGDVYGTAVQPDGMAVVTGSFVQVNASGTPVARNRAARVLGATGVADAFNPDLDSFSYCSAVLPDGKIMVGGAFTTVGGVARNRLARLHPNGTLDTDFNAQITFSGTVYAMALQGDGKLVVAGNFSGIGGGTQPNLARLNADGTLDTGFTPAMNSSGRSVAVQADGNIVVSGLFTSVNGQPFNRLARVSGIDGSLDPTFTNPNIVTSSNIECVAVQGDGKILVCGNDVMTIDGQTRNGIARLNANGTLDTGFDPDVGGTFPQVTSIVVRADKRILIGGQFTSIGGQTRNRIAMLLPNGQLEQFFDPNANSAVLSLALQADGKILAGGGFSNISGEARSKLARLSNDIATQALSVVDNNARIEWLRGGSSPETNLVTFDVSGDGGATWTPLGAATRVTFPSPGWQLTGATLPPTGHIRARAYPQGGRYNGSVSCLETITSYGTPPDIAVTENAVPILSGAVRNFGVVATGSATSVRQIIIQNTGGTPLTGLGGAIIEDEASTPGDHSSQFVLGRPASSALAPGATTTMTITYKPKTQGRHAAVVRIPSDDPDENPFFILIVGVGSQPFTTFKAQQTGDSATSDTADTNGNGRSLLEEYATGTMDDDGTSIEPPSGGGSFAPETNGAPPSGGTFLFNYQRNKLALADVVFQVEWSDTLAENDWHTDGVTEVILSDDDSIQQIQATVPAGTAGRRFARLKMTRP